MSCLVLLLNSCVGGSESSSLPGGTRELLGGGAVHFDWQNCEVAETHRRHILAKIGDELVTETSNQP